MINHIFLAFVQIFKIVLKISFDRLIRGNLFSIGGGSKSLGGLRFVDEESVPALFHGGMGQSGSRSRS